MVGQEAEAQSANQLIEGPFKINFTMSAAEKGAVLPPSAVSARLLCCNICVHRGQPLWVSTQFRCFVVVACEARGNSQ